MPALTFTADAGTDQLTITGHGLITGAGPGATRTYGGELPGGLAAVTDYWIIVIDANTVKLATSSANALLGTAIPLTTNGSGLLYLELGIPYRRARTYVAGVQVPSADLNSFEDSFSALHALLTGQPQSIWSAPAFSPDAKTVFPRPVQSSNWAASGATITDGSLMFKSTGAGYAEFRLSDYMNDGQTLKNLRLWLIGDGAVDVTAMVIAVDYDTPITTVVDTQVANNVAAGSITFLDFTTLIADAATAGASMVSGQLNHLWLRVECSAANAEMPAIILEFPP